jgi:deoxyribodipyrimidine photo-lyase
MKLNIVLFNDVIRITDNLALYKAAQQNLPIVGIYCFEPEVFQYRTFEHIERCAKTRLNYITSSLFILKQKLEKFKIPLIVSKKSIHHLISEIPFEINQVFAEEMMASQEKKAIKKLKKANYSINTFSSNGLLDSESLPFEISQLPDTFTQFRKIVEKKFSARKIYTPQLKTQTSLPFDISKWNDVELSQDKEAGEDKALERLNYYFFESKKVSTYKITRNGLLGPDYATRISPFLAQGSISAIAVYEQLQQYETNIEANESTYWVFFELLWREYFRWISVKYGDALFHMNGLKNESFQGYGNKAKFERWCNGETGIPFIDANMRELNTTGFMSNRGRQNVASFLCKDLGIDWRWGAAYFESKLIDYDVSSNWGNWCYVAGVGNDPRENRWFNIQKQAHNYDAKAIYIKHMIPELAHLSAEEAISPWKSEAGRKAYISPMFIHDKWF